MADWVRIRIRCTREQKELIRKAAQLCGQTMTDFIIESISIDAAAAHEENKDPNLCKTCGE